MLVGVVGKPNVGKSTFFKALTLAEVEIANYPFATIKPNHGVGHVRIVCVDSFFNTQCHPREGYCVQNSRFVPVELIDVAGLVPGAHAGKGLGNQFLDDLRQASVLIHVIDASGSTTAKGESVAPGSHDPAEDVRFLETELDMWYLGILKKSWEKFARKIEMEKQKVAAAIAKQFSGLNVTENMVKDAMQKLNLDADHVSGWTAEQLLAFAVALRQATKPMIIAANKADTKTAQTNIERLRQQFPEYRIVPCSAESELALKEAAKHDLIDYVPGDADFTVKSEEKLSTQQRQALQFIKATMLAVYDGTGVQQCLNTAVFDFLGCIAVFPGGVNNLKDQHGRVLPDCFLMPPKSTALDFAYRLHTDFGKNFIKAVDVKKKLPVGRDHVLQHGDVIEIMSRV